MYDQFLAKSFHTPNFGDEQFDGNSQLQNSSSSPHDRLATRAPGMTPSSDSSNSASDRQQPPSQRLTSVSTGMTPTSDTLSNHHLSGYPQSFFSAPLTQEQIYNMRTSYSQHQAYQQYKQHQMSYNPLEMLQQGYGMGPPAAVPPQVTPPVQTALETTSEDSDDSTPQSQLYAGLKRPSPDNCILNIQKKAKPQKKKKKRDPNEPQKPVSAYALFFRDTQAAIKGQNPNASFGEVSKIVASMWDTLDVEHKNVYKRKTEDAKKDYLKALAAYRASLVSKSGRETESTYTGYTGAGCYNGYSQHGYSPPTSTSGGGALSESHHPPTQQRVTHHHHGYSPPPGNMPGAGKLAETHLTSAHGSSLHHHGYSQTPGGGVHSDSRGTQHSSHSHGYPQQSSNQGGNVLSDSHLSNTHRVSQHQHAYSPSSGPSQDNTHSNTRHDNQHRGYSPSPGGATSAGTYSDNHPGSQDRNSQLSTHYHGYSPPRAVSTDTHQSGTQYASSGCSRLTGNSASTHQGYSTSSNPGGGGNSAGTHQGYSTSGNSGGGGTGAGTHQTYSASGNQGGSGNSDSLSGNNQHGSGGYSPHPGGGSLSDTHHSGIRGVTHHHQGYQQLSAPNSQPDNRQSSSQQSNQNHHQGYSPNPGGNQQDNHQAGSQTVSSGYSPSSAGESHHHHASTHRVSHHHQGYSPQNSPYNGYSPRLSGNYEGYSQSPTGHPAQAAGPLQSIVNQECIQNQQQQQSQVLMSRHMAPPGGQHMAVHQPPPI